MNVGDKVIYNGPKPVSEAKPEYNNPVYILGEELVTIAEILKFLNSSISSIHLGGFKVYDENDEVIGQIAFSENSEYAFYSPDANVPS